ncbi:nuclear fragile mental retardation-interacting protein [Salix suchowensis]|nr:nuclear fragile mental retardation-interacting protein [Salix suchowensis]
MQQPWSQANFTGADYYQSGAYSSHYARAYMQSLDGQQGSHSAPQASTSTSFYESNPSNGHRQQRAPFDTRPPSWHQHGSHQCTYLNCKFTGSPKTLEIHRMDRHLIYPPGWDKQRKKNDWDADPSLKGKPIPIQGTNIFLDTLEAVKAWREERKRRWPSKDRVEDKKRKMSEAIARGQLTMEDIGAHGNKRRRADGGYAQSNRGGRGNGRGSNRGMRGGRGRGGGNQRGVVLLLNQFIRSAPAPAPSVSQPAKLPLINEVAYESSSDNDSDAAPEVVSSKVTAALPPKPVEEALPDSEIPPVKLDEARSLRPVKKPAAPRPPRQLHNPFSSHHTLLRSVSPLSVFANDIAHSCP